MTSLDFQNTVVSDSDRKTRDKVAFYTSGPPKWLNRQPYEPSYPAHRSSRLPSSDRRFLHKKINTYVVDTRNDIPHEDTSESETANKNVDLEIQRSLLSLLPDISYEYETSTLEWASGANDRILSWIQTTKQYMAQLHYDFNIACDYIIHRNKLFSGLVNKSADLDMRRVEGLPEDVVRHIASYLGPETRLKFYQGFILSLPVQLSKLSAVWLKKIYKYAVRHRYFHYLHLPISHARHYAEDPEVANHFTKAQHLAMRNYTHNIVCQMPYNNTPNKTVAIQRIMAALRMYQQLDTRAPTNYLKYRFHEEGVRLVHALLYLIRQFREKKASTMRSRRTRA
jgi:hypothetical protein